MQIERSSNDKITITLSTHIDSLKLQRLIDYIKYLELTSKSKAKQSDADKLAEGVNASWWEKNRQNGQKSVELVVWGPLKYEPPYMQLR